jgi:hypothetical protein
MKLRWSGMLAIAAMLLGAVSAFAHHSFAAEFDIDKPLTLKGVVTRVEWVNPHVYLYLDAKDDSGKITQWALSSLGPAAVRRGGVTRAMLGQGQAVTIQAYHAKDGSNFAFMRKMTFADGHSVELWLGDAAAKQ